MKDSTYCFPFGKPVLERIPEISEPRFAYILGAYPSALHVFWQPPDPFRAIKAFAVDNEPDFFWNGLGEEQYIEFWKSRVGFTSSWGSVGEVGPLNGSSGIWVDQNVLQPLGISRQSAWISDCLTTYRTSKGQSDRISNTYIPFAESLSLPGSNLLHHPSENSIVEEALKTHKSRLQQEIDHANPDLIVTLGNAALRVLSQLVKPLTTFPTKLDAYIMEYGKPIEVKLSSGKGAVWYPLVHPGQRASNYVRIHENWVRNIGKKA